MKRVISEDIGLHRSITRMAIDVLVKRTLIPAVIWLVSLLLSIGVGTGKVLGSALFRGHLRALDHDIQDCAFAIVHRTPRGDPW